MSIPGETDDIPPPTSEAMRAEESLDEAILESFPASDPGSTWSGLSESDGMDEAADETGGESA